MSTNNRKKNPVLHLIAGGVAGFTESTICHPLDTIKTRVQLRSQPDLVVKHVLSSKTPLLNPSRLHDPPMRLTPKRPATTLVTVPLGPLATASHIVRNEGFFSLYKGLTAVYMGIIPKMAIRFVSFEQYRDTFHRLSGGEAPSSFINFSAGLASGITEAVLVVTPAEVCKIRLQIQPHSLTDPEQLRRRKYTNVFQTAFTIVREEGLSALYQGVVPTMLRQGCNQAVNFTGYHILKQMLLDRQRDGTKELAHWQSLLLGGLSGGLGPLVNNPLDVVKTRMQKQVVTPDKVPKYSGVLQSIVLIAKDEGIGALWKGIIPRLLRIMPGQAITFMTYEAVIGNLQKLSFFQ